MIVAVWHDIRDTRVEVDNKHWFTSYLTFENVMLASGEFRINGTGWIYKNKADVHI